MRSLEISVLKTIAYFDVFSYPLTIEEILFFLDCPAAENEVAATIEYLVEAKQVWQLCDFYSIRNEPAIAERRIRGNELAVKYIRRARTVAKFLSWFPFVRGIAISGSLSKNFAGEDVDLDFFVITKANRLWITRILYTILFKIAMVIRMKEWFCLNYFIDELGLKIKEQNIFTAVEISTLMPLKGGTIFREFFKVNNWVYQYQPNYTPNYTYLEDRSTVIPKRIAEWVMNFEIGNKADNKLRLIFKKRFERILAKNKLSAKGLMIGAFEANKHTCKPLPQYFQPKILAMFHERFMIVKNKYFEITNKEMIQ